MSGGWIQTFGGRAFYPLAPRVEDVDLIDIAHALSHLCRYGGHSRVLYTVAQHCVLVSQHVPPEHALDGLMHDAAEAYLCDLPRPIKRSLPDYAAAERLVYAAIAQRFGLAPEEPEAVKLVDRRILADERRALLMPMLRDQPDWGPGDPPLGIAIEAWPPHKAKWEFIERFGALNDARGRPAPAASDAVVEDLFA